MTKKKLVFVFLLLLFLFLFIWLLYKFNYISHKKYSNEYFGIDTYISSIDKDNDGIDDQSDILIGAKEYINKKPKYKSKYYATGYPDDGYGVCSDVVDFALLNAGYNLMDLVNQDIVNNREKYNIQVIDKNIDFRRVVNLKVYFDNNAIKLTNDIYDIDAWQGGDIVVFKHHIGIVSDNRNKNGVSFIIHHANKWQINYEEDILEDRNDIVGHYRIS